MYRHAELAPALTSIAVLLSRKQHLINRLEKNPGPREREEIERLLERIDAALDSVDSPDRL